MTTNGGPASYRERQTRFGRQNGLLGVWCEPRSGVRAIPVVILGAGILHRVGPSRISVLLARALAEAGHPVLRFDLSGIGDSARASEASLEEAVRNDIADAIQAATELVAQSSWSNQVALIGFCSGADNAIHVASDDPRVRAAVLFDPSVSRTAGFRRREMVRRFFSAQSWINLLTGRSVRLRLSERRARASVLQPPPGYYGLLVSSPEDTDRRVGRICTRGGRLRYVISSGVRRYLNSPVQIRESLPSSFDPRCIDVVWADHLDHVFGTRRQVEWFVHDSVSWLAQLTPAPEHESAA